MPARLQAALDLTRALSGHLVCIDVTPLPLMADTMWGVTSGAILYDEGEREAANVAKLQKRLAEEDVTEFIFQQLDLCGLGHNVFQEGALELIVRSSDGVLRYARNLCLGSLLGAMRARTRTVSTDLVNEVLLQPHWRKEQNVI